MNVINESDLDIEGILATQIPEYVEQPTQEVREEQPAPQVEAQPEN